MFGSSKNSTKGPADILNDRITGLERAKMERSGEPRGLTVDQVLGALDQAPTEARPNVQKRSGPTTEKPKPGAEAAHLYVGAGIKLKGEVTGCDMLRVEGVYEGSAQSRQLLLCAGSSFIGTAYIDEAEVEGVFDGTLHVRGRLFLRNKGLIKGQFSYGQLEIERGGQIDGQITPFEKPQTAALKPAEAAKPVAAPMPLAAPRPVAAKLVAPAATPRPAVAQPLNGSQPNPSGAR